MGENIRMTLAGSIAFPAARGSSAESENDQFDRTERSEPSGSENLSFNQVLQGVRDRQSTLARPSRKSPQKEQRRPHSPWKISL